MPVPFDTLTRADAEKLVVKPDGFDEAEAMVYREEPDQRDCGAGFLSGFVGPTGLDTRGLSEMERRAVAALDRDVRDDLARAFTPVDRLSEVSGRRVDGLLKRPPAMRFVLSRPHSETADGGETTTSGGGAPTDDEQALLAELGAVVARAEALGLHAKLRRLVHAVNAFGHAYLRFYVPAGRATGRNGSLPAADLAEALDHIHVEVVTPDRAVVATDNDTGDRAGIVALPGKDGRRGPLEISYAERGTGSPPLTVHRLLTADGSEAPEVRMPLRGRMLLVEALDENGAFIDAGTRQLQKALNTSSTQKRLVLDQDSLRVRVLLGAQPPGEFVKEVGEDGQETLVFKESPWELPLGAIAHVSGQEVYDPKELDAGGNPIVTGLTNPRMGEFSAADAARYQADVDARTLQIRDRTKQAWVSTTGEAGVSGISREVAMSDYDADAEAVAASIAEPAAEEALEILADYGAHIAGRGGAFYGFHAEVRCTISTAPPSPEGRRVTMELGKSGVWSMERVRTANGVDDPDAEAAAIRSGQTEADRLQAVATRLAAIGAASPTLAEKVAAAAMDEAAVEFSDAERAAIAAEARQSATESAQRTALDDILDA